MNMALVTLEKLKTLLVVDHDNMDYELSIYRDWAEAELQRFHSKTLVNTVTDEASETLFNPIHEKYVVMAVALYSTQRTPVSEKAVSVVPGLALDHLLMQARGDL